MIHNPLRSAPRALSAGGQPAGLVVDAALVEGASGSAARPPPRPFPAATTHVEVPMRQVRPLLSAWQQEAHALRQVQGCRHG